MSETAFPRSDEPDDTVSFFALGVTLLRNRRRILMWTLAGGVIATLLVFTTPKMYEANATFISQGADATHSNLASLAGQFGVALQSGNPSQSPEFYVRLVQSRVLLERVARDTIPVTEKGRRVPFLDLFSISGENQEVREEKAVKLLSRIVSASVEKPVGIVKISVSTEWPSVSLFIVRALVDGVNDFNRVTRQGQAVAERQFVQDRLADASAQLRAAEDRLAEFMSTNRQFANSPELSFQRERLQRDVTLRQGVVTTLTQSYEDARIREVRDTPLITVLEPPFVPSIAQPRGRLRAVFFGLLFGAFFGVLLAFVRHVRTRLEPGGNSDADEFFQMWDDVRRKLRFWTKKKPTVA